MGERAVHGGLPLRWAARLPLMARAREGGPGRPLTLALHLSGALGLLWAGQARMAAWGIDNAGPAMLLLAALWLGALALWLLIKLVLRPRNALFEVDTEAVRIHPVPAQARLDRRVRFWVQLAFLISWKGGQWGDFAPHLRWRDLRAVRFEPRHGEILLRGGPWDIRLICPPGRYDAIAAQVMALAPAASARC